ncbi:MAG: family 43 glycosylhydrolase [Cyclobacteriaceae bacterium]
MIKRLYIYVALRASLMGCFAQNPITPPGVYMADPEARVWPDGKLYIYGSRDESDDYWCSYAHDVFSTNDLKNWTLHENVFSSVGANDEVDYHDELLFAPDCAYRDGTYYLYYCSPHERYTEGVATSSSPTGPFTKGQHIEGAYQIDPAVLIDDDGQGYYYWGQGTVKVAKMKADLTEIESTTIIEPMDSIGNLYFHEGASIRKIGTTYYLVFADESRNWRPTCLGYATSQSPMGPFKYQGVIIDNYGSDPAVWNNHGSIQEYNGQWYVFYHRSTNNSQKFRKACIEPITINDDGSINEVPMTSQGAGQPLLATEKIEAEWACRLSGNVRVKPDTTGTGMLEVLGQMLPEDYTVYRYLDFDKGAGSVKLRSASSAGGTIDFRLDSLSGPLLSQMTITAGSGYQTHEAPTDLTTGVHELYVIFSGEEDSEVTIDWFRFTEKRK